MQKQLLYLMKKSAIGSLAGLFFTLAATFAVSTLVYSESIAPDKTNIVMKIILFAACIISGIISSRRTKAGKWRCVIATGTIILLIVLLLTAVCSERVAIAETAVNTLIVASGTSLGCIICAKNTKKKRRKHARYNK